MNNEKRNDEISRLVFKLKSKNGLIRKWARKKLVSIGTPAVPLLSELIDQPAAKLRWEVVKALSQIADHDSTPLFINALYDKDEEVRWLAAEGLIEVGTYAIKPILQELIKNPKSVLLRNGAHHYLSKIQELDKSFRFKDLLSSLNAQDAELSTPDAAEKLLKVMNFKK